MLKKVTLILLLSGILFPANSQLFKFGYKKGSTDELTISKNERKKKVEIFVKDDLSLDNFIKPDSNFITKAQSYISPSFVGKIVNPNDEPEVYSNSFDEDFVLLFVYRSDQKYFDEGVSGVTYFGFSSASNRIIVNGRYRIEEISNDEILELIQITLTEKQWKELSISENVELHAFGEDGISVGKLTQKYMRLISSEISKLSEEWY